MWDSLLVSTATSLKFCVWESMCCCLHIQGICCVLLVKMMIDSHCVCLVGCCMWIRGTVAHVFFWRRVRLWRPVEDPIRTWRRPENPAELILVPCCHLWAPSGHCWRYQEASTFSVVSIQLSFIILFTLRCIFVLHVAYEWRHHWKTAQENAGVFCNILVVCQYKLCPPTDLKEYKWSAYSTTWWQILQI